ncbi:MAG: membrane protein insertion efficiency factor YidD [Pseudonocardiales bacterium]|nr:membrane protein insertion efficiency factor YidD [Pseudonocardiales bacterium]PZS26116.1 MAG: membrane protein insertion efficiency factor YidD [Pseudonocardiales bacterium]
MTVLPPGAQPAVSRDPTQVSALRVATGPVVRLLVVILRFYRQWISPALPPSCRFFPSCSAYAIEALTVHGMLRGSWLTVRRVLRCGPWHPGGVDPVPPTRSPRSPAESES